MVRVLYATLALANGYLYDTFFPNYTSSCQCDSWSKHAQYFSGGKVPSNAGSQCALVSGKADNGNSIDHSHAWPWCFCNGTPKMCKPPKRTVEQLNLQMASADVLVAGFVTYETVSGQPKGMIGTSESNMQEVTGESHKFNSFSGKVSHDAYAMHYVPFRNLQPRQTYYYKVKSGTGDWTDTFSFRTPGQSGTTKLAVFGDMGVDKDNNMGNLKDDCDSEAIDAVLHMGDHAYHLQDQNDKTGDGYMNYFQPVLSKCPWLPVVGNHENAEIKRFDAIVKGLPMDEHDLDAAFHSKNFSSTADTALGHHLTLGAMLGRGLHSKVPSGSSRFTSADIGLVHVIGLDTEWSGDEEKTWLEKDLKEADANRHNVPWIMIINHYPGYIDNGKSSAMMANASTEAYFSDDGEYDRSMRYRTCEAMGQNGDQCETVGEWQVQVQHGMEPLYLKYGVDFVGGGHHHHYQMTYPMKNSKECQKDYDKPSCPVYFTEGNGGVPGRCSNTCKLSSCTESWCRIDGNNCGAYGRITATKTSFTYDHVQNKDGKVTDSITITKSVGPSPPPSPPSPPSPSPPPPTPPPPAPPPPTTTTTTAPPAPTPSPPSPTPPSPAPTPSGSDTLPASGELLPGESLVSASGAARLSMQASDGNCVLHHGSDVVWATGTSGHPGAHLKFQISGPKLIVRDTDNTDLWNSGKHANAEKVVLLDSCELVMQDSNGNKVWGTNTQCPSAFTV